MTNTTKLAKASHAYSPVAGVAGSATGGFGLLGSTQNTPGFQTSLTMYSIILGQKFPTIDLSDYNSMSNLCVATMNAANIFLNQWGIKGSIKTGTGIPAVRKQRVASRPRVVKASRPRVLQAA